MAHTHQTEDNPRRRNSATPSPPSPEAAHRIATDAGLRWATTPISHRLQILSQFRSELVRRAESLAELSPRPRAEFLSSEVIPLADACRWLERCATKTLKPRRVGSRGRPGWLRGSRARVVREPFGVILLIAPSNYPLFLPGVSLLQALAAGNAVVVKPGDGGGWAAAAIVDMFRIAGLPDGLVTVLDEARETGIAALECDFDKVLFTGSAETGRKVLAATANSLTPATVELSGCDLVLVLPDADEQLAERAIAFGLTLNGGCTCIAPRRIYLPAERERAFVKALGEELSRRPTSSVDDATLAKLDRLAAGERPSLGGTQADGSFAAAVYTGIDPEHPLANADIFAPVCSVFTYHDVDEAVDLANRCPYQLGASVFGSSALSRETAERLHVGNVSINDLIVPTADPRLPFPARGKSGFGQLRGDEGLLALTRPKVVTERRGRWRPHLDPPQDGDAELLSGYLQLAHGATLRARFSGLGRLKHALKHRNTKKTNRFEA